LDAYLAAQGGDFGGLLVFAALFGFGGAFISLARSKWMAKRSMGVHVIERPSDAGEAWLVDTVAKQARAAGIGMPEVGIFDSPDPNAFATGANRNAALVAVSTGLLQRMRRQEVEAVLGHEIGHVANGDMVTLTLIQGVVNTFVIFFARVVGYFVDSWLRRNDEESSGPGIGYMITVVVCEIVFGILASIIVAAFSRRREFRADAGAAGLMGNTAPMVNALRRLGGLDADGLPQNMQAMGISGGKSWLALFSSHPPIEARIAALQGSGR
ncbi:MAG: protease HtpX, partial [Cupriavidus sp.]